MNTRGLFLCLLLGAATAAAQQPARPDSAHFFAVPDGVDVYGLADDRGALRAQVRDPLFAFVFTMTERDSLGVWSAEDILAFAEAWGEDSAFPLAENLATIAREPLADEAAPVHRGVRCDRRWVVRLRPERLEIPMPYSILGYHPGSLSFDSPLVLREWRLGSRTAYVTVEGQTRRYAAHALTIYEIAAGWIVLDVDGWLDALLGKAADDAAMQGFAVAWVEGELVGVGNSVGRGGRRILGELDFRTGEVATHGRPLARAISRYGRGWTTPRDEEPQAVWRRYDR